MLTEPKNVADFGLRFLLEWQKDLFLPEDLIGNIYKAIGAVALARPGEMLPIKEAAEGEALTDDDKQTNADNAAANE